MSRVRRKASTRPEGRRWRRPSERLVKLECPGSYGTIPENHAARLGGIPGDNEHTNVMWPVQGQEKRSQTRWRQRSTSPGPWTPGQAERAGRPADSSKGRGRRGRRSSPRLSPGGWRKVWSPAIHLTTILSRSWVVRRG